MTKPPTLSDPKGMGGVIAQDGFDYQVWDALIRLPSWLRNPAFEGMALETLEDLEARFFAPQAPRGHLIDRFQAKSGALTRSDLINVFSAFRTFEASYPHAARIQTLVTPGLPPALNWIARDSGRIRRARPFYSPFSDIRAASDDELRADLVSEFGKDLGDFFADNVEISLRVLPDRASAEAAFASALHDSFPNLDISASKVRAGFSALNDLAGRNRGAMLTPGQLFDALSASVGEQLVQPGPFAIHVRSTRNGEVANALEIDASSFSGGQSGFPHAKRWREELLVPLEKTAAWARKRNHARIALSGSYRLTTAFAIGWAFRSAIGFEIEIPTKAECWPTDEHPAVNASPLPCTIVRPRNLVHGRLVVAVGVLRDPTPDIRQDRVLHNGDVILAINLPQALTCASDVQSFVRIVKDAVSQEVAHLRPTGIDLYYVGPAAFAVALGHRWNALPATQLHEFLARSKSYTPSVEIG
jgi:hypothetical protein